MNLTCPKTFLYLSLIFILILPLYGQTVNTGDLQIRSCWEYSSKNLPKQIIESDNAKDIFIKDDKFIRSIDTVSGEINWTFDTGGAIVSRILVDSESIYAANLVKKIEKNDARENAFIIRAISKKTGLTFWKVEIEFDLIAANKNTAKNTHIYNTKDGILIHSSLCFVYINKSDGSLKWKKCFKIDVSGSIVASNISDDIFVFYDGMKIYNFVVETSEILLEIPVETQITSIQLIDKLRIVYGDKKGNIRSVNTQSGKNFYTIKFGGEVSSISKTKAGLLVTSFDNFIYMVDINSGRKIWKKRFANRIKDKPLIRDEIAILVSGDKNAFFINISDGRIINQINLPIDNNFLGPPIFVNKYFLFLTDRGISAFTDSVCHKEESGQEFVRSAFIRESVMLKNY